jgi:hypothetical protein
MRDNRDNYQPVMANNPGADYMVFNKMTGLYRDSRDNRVYRWNKWAQRYEPAVAPPSLPPLSKIGMVKNLSSSAAKGEVRPEQAEKCAEAVADTVHLPKHYKQFTWEPMRVAMENKLNPLQFNILKYSHRYALKNGVEDLRKAARSVEMLIKFEQGDPDWWR